MNEPSFHEWAKQIRQQYPDAPSRAMSDLYRKQYGRGPTENDFAAWADGARRLNPDQELRQDDLRAEYESSFGPLEEHGSDFARGLRDVWSETKGLAGGAKGLVAATAGNEEARDAGIETYRRNMAEVHARALPSDRLEYLQEHGSLGDWVDSVQYHATKGLGNLAVGLGAGGILGLAGRQGAKALVAKGATDLVRQQAATTGLKVGGYTGLGAQAFGMELGETYGQAVDSRTAEGGSADDVNLGKTWLGGGAAGALEFASDALLATGASLLPGLAKKMAAPGVKGAFKGAGVAAPMEALTEGGQYRLEAWGSETPWNATDLKQSMYAGFVGGAAAGGAMNAAFNRPDAQNIVAPPGAPPVTPGAPPVTPGAPPPPGAPPVTPGAPTPRTPQAPGWGTTHFEPSGLARTLEPTAPTFAAAQRLRQLLQIPEAAAQANANNPRFWNSKAQAVNKLLADAGLQTKVNKEWVLTPEGQKYATENGTTWNRGGVDNFGKNWAWNLAEVLPVLEQRHQDKVNPGGLLTGMDPQVQNKIVNAKTGELNKKGRAFVAELMALQTVEEAQAKLEELAPNTGVFASARNHMAQQRLAALQAEQAAADPQLDLDLTATGADLLETGNLPTPFADDETTSSWVDSLIANAPSTTPVVDETNPLFGAATDTYAPTANTAAVTPNITAPPAGVTPNIATPPTATTAPPTANTAPPTANTAPPTANTAAVTPNTAPPTANTAAVTPNITAPPANPAAAAPAFGGNPTDDTAVQFGEPAGSTRQTYPSILQESGYDAVEVTNEQVAENDARIQGEPTPAWGGVGRSISRDLAQQYPVEAVGSGIKAVRFYTQGNQEGLTPDKATVVTHDAGYLGDAPVLNSVVHWDEPIGVNGTFPGFYSTLLVNPAQAPAKLVNGQPRVDVALAIVPDQFAESPEHLTDPIDRAVANVVLETLPDGRVEVHVDGPRDGATSRALLEQLGLTIQTPFTSPDGSSYQQFPLGDKMTRQLGRIAARAYWLANGRQDFELMWPGRDTGANPRVAEHTMPSRRVQSFFGEPAPQTQQPSTPEALSQQLTDLTGKAAHWRVHIYANAAEAVAAGHPPSKLQGTSGRGAYGWVETKDGKRHAYFIADRIDAGRELGAFMHEVGAHLGMESVIPAATRANLVNQVRAWVKNANTPEGRIAQAALARIPEGTKNADAELIAYTLQEAADAGIVPSTLDRKTPLGRWLHAAIELIKRALRVVGVNLPETVSMQDLVDLAYGAARTELARGNTQAQEGVSFGNTQHPSDRQYFDAYNRGDEAEMQRLVHEAAKRAGVPLLPEDAGNVPRQAWNANKGGVFDVLDLDALGYDPQFNHVNHKLLDPVTYDNNGNVIPLSQRFNQDIEDIRYGEMPPAIKRQQEVIGRTVSDWAVKGFLLGAFTRQAVKYAAKVLPAAQTFYDSLSAAEQVRQQYQGRVEHTVEKFDLLPADVQAEVQSYLRDSTRNETWGYQPEWSAHAQVDPAAQQRFEALRARSPAAAELVIEINRFGFDILARKQELMEKLVTESYGPRIAAAQTPQQREKLEKTQAVRVKAIRQLHGLTGPYAPFKRFGSLVVVGTSQKFRDARAQGLTSEVNQLKSDPKHYWVEFAETRSEAFRARDRLRQDTDLQVEEPFERSAFVDSFGVDFRAFEKLRTTILDDTAQGEHQRKLVTMVDDLLVSSLVQDHARKAEMHRRKVGGEDPDMIRAFATQGQADSRYLANLETMRQTHEALLTMRRQADAAPNKVRARQMFNELYKRYRGALDDDAASPLVSTLVRASAAHHLLLSPAYYVINALQVGMMGQPLLAGRHGYNDSWGAIFTAYRGLAPMLKGTQTFERYDIAKLEIPADERDALTYWVNRGLLDVTQAMDLSARTRGGASKVGRVWDRTIARLPGKLEIINRVVTGLAAYRLELAKNGGDQAAARAYAEEVIALAQGDYTALNTPRAISSYTVPGARVWFQFRKFQLIQLTYMTHLVKESLVGASPRDRAAAFKAFSYMLAHYGVMGGALGLPAASLIGWAIAAFFGDDDVPKDTERLAREGLKSWGWDDSMIDLVLNGLPALLGVPLTKRVGAGDMVDPLPFLDVGAAATEGEAGYGRAWAALGGPIAGGLTLRAWQGYGLMAEGQYYRGLEKFMPRGLLEGGMKAYRTATDGETARNGDRVLTAEEFTLWDTLAQTLGFSPALQNKRWAAQGQVSQIEKHFERQSGRLKREYVKAYEQGRQRDLARLRNEWLETQQARRGRGLRPLPLSDLLRAPMQQAKRERQVVGGVKYDRGTRGLVERTAATYR